MWSSPNVATIFATLLMGTIVIAALLTKTRMRVPGMVIWRSIVIVIVFALSSYAQFRFGLA